MKKCITRQPEITKSIFYISVGILHLSDSRDLSNNECFRFNRDTFYSSLLLTTFFFLFFFFLIYDCRLLLKHPGLSANKRTSNVQETIRETQLDVVPRERASRVEQIDR